MNLRLSAGFAALLFMCVACNGTGSEPTESGAVAPVATDRPTVEVVFDEGRYRLWRNGEPYEVRGAGIEYGDLSVFAAHGGNSFRTWRTDNAERSGQEVLDEAARNGLTVAMCIDIGRERLGFDYDDVDAVAAQLEFARGEVEKYKDHPALLTWIIGNEPNLQFKNPRVFDAINDISTMIHELDGNHPTTTALAGFSEELAGLIDQRAADLDFVSIQMYGDIVHLPTLLAKIGFDKPYFVTEWGAIGHWEVGKTEWGAPIEQDSSAKADNYMKSYEVAIASDPQRVLGSFVFLWGQKQERTPTWYGMFLPTGEKTQTIDVMHNIWTGAWPDNRSPQIESILLDGRTATDSIALAANEQVAAHVAASDPDTDELSYRWEVVPESAATQEGGDSEEIPLVIAGLVDDASRRAVTVTAPAEEGAYRLFVYVYDGNGSAGHANIPFYVR